MMCLSAGPQDSTVRIGQDHDVESTNRITRAERNNVCTDSQVGERAMSLYISQAIFHTREAYLRARTRISRPRQSRRGISQCQKRQRRPFEVLIQQTVSTKKEKKK